MTIKQTQSSKRDNDKLVKYCIVFLMYTVFGGVELYHNAWQV